MNFVYLDGSILPENEAFIPISDRGLLMGDGVFVTLQIKDGSPLFLKRHLQKLDEQAKKLHMSPCNLDEHKIFELIEKNNALSGIHRLKIYYTGGNDPAMRLPEGRTGRLLMILKPYNTPPYGPLKVGLYPQPIMALQSNIKSLSHVSRYMIMEQALRMGYDDCITMGEKATVLETAFGNVFWIKDQEFYTPHPILPLHFGITISIVSELAETLGFTCHFVRKSVSEIPEGSYLFRTNTMGGIRPIVYFEGRTFARDLSLEEKFLQAYESKIEATQLKLSLR